MTGQLKTSIDGKKIASTVSIFHSNSSIELYDFNASRGSLTNQVILKPNKGDAFACYGVEFSPDGKKLYISYPQDLIHTNTIIISQYNLESEDIRATEYKIQTFTYPGIVSPQLQLALDGKIYVSYLSRHHLSVIEEPNELKDKAGFS